MVVLSAGTPRNRPLSASFLEGANGDTGLMWECVKTIFDQIDYRCVHKHSNDFENNSVFYRSCTVQVSAVEVLSGRVKDLLKEAGNLGDGTDVANDGAADDGKDWTDPSCPSGELTEALLKVEITNQSDFNKIVGVIASVRSMKKRQVAESTHSHSVITLTVMNGTNLWCKIVFVDLTIPQVDDCVLYGEDEFEDQGHLNSGNYTQQTRNSERSRPSAGRRHKRDLLYAQEDVNFIVNALSSRARFSPEEKKAEDNNSNAALAKVMGDDLVKEGAACRVFVHMSALSYDREETKDTASGLLFASMSMADGGGL